MAGAKQKPITMAMEDYLEAIYDLGREKKVVRVRDIAARLDVKMPTVTSMLKNLNERGLVDYEKYEYVDLTAKGRAVGREMHRRHDVLRRFLTEILKIDARTSDEEACQLEHALSTATLNRLIQFMDFIHECPRTGETWLERFDVYLKDGFQFDRCKANLEDLACLTPSGPAPPQQTIDADSEK